ncbi:MAG: response regulator [Methylococcales bacterium]|jgi:Response regulators consisting of a CheY-like receiver domain and a winged-helix DNA-binding domain|nr:response regulator [Candidatus Thioglobus sp.]
MQNILLVEDDKVIAEGISFALESDSFKVNWCEMGNDALDHLNNNAVDLVLLDIGLPDMSGFDVLRKIRKTLEVPVIIITARDDDADIVLGLEGLGADDYVTKPFNPRVLVARIRAQLRHVRMQNEPVQVVTKNHKEVFAINEDLNQILLNEQVLHLTNAECKILSCLVEKPNRIHSKEHLLSIMWDRPHGSSEGTIVTHIRSIRRALNKIEPDNEYIKNHRGLGYSLVL